MTEAGNMTVEHAADEMAGNWKKFDSFAWFRRRELTDPDAWAVAYTHHRPPGLGPTRPEQRWGHHAEARTLHRRRRPRRGVREPQPLGGRPHRRVLDPGVQARRDHRRLPHLPRRRWRP